MAWNKIKLERLPQEEPVVLIGRCNRCFQCCVSWKYEEPDGPAGAAPKKEWCPNLDVEKRACRIWEERPEGCWTYPTVRDFELGSVPEACGFKLIKGENYGQVCKS